VEGHHNVALLLRVVCEAGLQVAEPESAVAFHDQHAVHLLVAVLREAQVEGHVALGGGHGYLRGAAALELLGRAPIVVHNLGLKPPLD
jgi:hypothetical protein